MLSDTRDLPRWTRLCSSRVYTLRAPVAPEGCQKVLDIIADDMQALFHSMRPFAVACLVTALGRRTAGADLQPVLYSV